MCSIQKFSDVLSVFVPKIIQFTVKEQQISFLGAQMCN